MIGLGVAGITSYLIGSIPFSQIAASLEGKDLRRIWDGNVGFTNLEKHVKSKLSIALSLLGDLGKGMSIVPLSRHIASYFGENPEATLFVASFFVVIGHIFSLFLKFSGGMGQLTALGVLLVANPVLTVLVFASRYIETLFMYGAIGTKTVKEKFLANNLAATLAILMIAALVTIYDVPHMDKIVFYGAISGVLVGYIKRYIIIKNNKMPILGGRKK